MMFFASCCDIIGITGTVALQTVTSESQTLYCLCLSPTALQPGVGLGLLQEFPPSFPV